MTILLKFIHFSLALSLKNIVVSLQSNSGEREKNKQDWVVVLRASLCKILISSFAHKMDFAHNFSVDFV